MNRIATTRHLVPLLCIAALAAATEAPAQEATERARNGTAISDLIRAPADRSVTERAVTTRLPRKVQIPLKDDGGTVRAILSYHEGEGEAGPLLITDPQGVVIGQVWRPAGVIMRDTDTDLFGMTAELAKLRKRVGELEAKVNGR